MMLESEIITNIALAEEDDVANVISTFEDISKQYKVIETYEGAWSDSVVYDIRYDNYAVFPNYVVNVGSSKKYIYEKPSEDAKKIDSLNYGNKFAVIALIENEDAEQWYVLECEDDDKEAIGYVQEKKVAKREFQIDKMIEQVKNMDVAVNGSKVVFIENYKSTNGYPPRQPNGKSIDSFGYRRAQAAAGYYDNTLSGEFRYVHDGIVGTVEEVLEITKIEEETLIVNNLGEYITRAEADNELGYTEENVSYEKYRQNVREEYNKSTIKSVKVFFPCFDESLWVKEKYLSKEEDTLDEFDQAIIVDRKNQNITVFEKDKVWNIISMSYSSTGKTGTYSLPTPIGEYMALSIRAKFDYVADGTTEIVGFAPYTIRFSAGAYLHGVPMSYKFDGDGEKIKPRTYAEYLRSIGTTPKSHMCVRNYTSHAKFMYKWANIGSCVVIVIE